MRKICIVRIVALRNIICITCNSERNIIGFQMRRMQRPACFHSREALTEEARENSKIARRNFLEKHGDRNGGNQLVPLMRAY